MQQTTHVQSDPRGYGRLMNRKPRVAAVFGKRGTVQKRKSVSKSKAKVKPVAPVPLHPKKKRDIKPSHNMRRVAQLFDDGSDIDRIAATLDLKPVTVRNYLSRMGRLDRSVHFLHRRQRIIDEFHRTRNGASRIAAKLGEDRNYVAFVMRLHGLRARSEAPGNRTRAVAEFRSGVAVRDIARKFGRHESWVRGRWPRPG